MTDISNPIIAEIDARAREQGLTLTGLAKKAQLNSKTLTAKKHTSGGPQARTMQRVAEALGCTPADILTSAARRAGGFAEDAPRPFSEIAPAPTRRRLAARGQRDLPVHGTAAGSALNGFEISPATIEYVHRPPALDGVADAYAIYVVSESMAPRHNPGDLCFIHPHRPYRAGDSVIIQTQTYAGGPISAYIKTYVRTKAKEIVASQFNPPATLTYNRDTVVSVHKVMTMNDLFGV